MKTVSRILGLFLMLLALNTTAQIIDSTMVNQKVLVTTQSGMEYSGVLIKMSKTDIVIATADGDITLLKSKIRNIKINDYDGDYGFVNPHATRYFFGPSAVPLGKGNGYYQNVLLSSNFVNVGISENLSIGGGFELISLLVGEPLWFLTPKVGFQVDKMSHVGGGIFIAGASADAVGLGYGVYTYGTKDNNVSFGYGYGAALDAESSGGLQVLMFSGTTRISRSLSLLTENYYMSSNTTGTYFGIHGFRIMSRKNSFDIGLMLSPAISDLLPALPFVGYSRVF